MSAPEKILSLPQNEEWTLDGLQDSVQVLRTEGNVPHIYGSNRRDVAFVEGFVIARDRFFMMDLMRRLGLGRVSELVGDLALSTDAESRLTGMTLVADRIARGFSEEHGQMADAFAAGVNAYIDQVKARKLPLPTEMRLIGPLLGVRDPRQLMEPFTRRDVGGILAVIVYGLSFEGGDVGQADAYARMDRHFTGVPFEALRRAGLETDIAPTIAPLMPIGSSTGFGIERADGFIPGPHPEDIPGARPFASRKAGLRRGPVSPPSELLTRVADRLEVIRERLGRVDGFGSNTWALTGAHTPSGATLVAGDGHLPLDLPPIFYQLGFDTSVFGNGPIHQLGLTIPGFFIIAVGTNGNVAWSQTQLSADVTDWYQEQIQLDEAGLPVASLFKGEWKPLQRIDEGYVIRDIPSLGSVGRTESWPRWVVFDGRLITDIEGRRGSAGDAGPGESAVRTLAGETIPGDTNGDGVVSAISVDYSGYDVVRLLDGVDGFGTSADAEELRQHARTLIAYSQNIVAGDNQGNVVYTPYHAVPCRGYLERTVEGDFAEGANPRRLIDGTRFGGFTVPMTDGLVDETAADGDPQRCLVPFDSTPQSLSPARGYVLSANNDPAHIAMDNSLENDPWYIGGSWDTGFRASTIDRELARLVTEKSADAQSMADLQGNHQSRLGEIISPYLIESIEQARLLQISDKVLNPSEQRIVDLYTAEQAAMDEVVERLLAWGTRGFAAESGVETFYHSLGDHEEENAVATMVFNAWLSRFMHAVWDDEGIDGRLFHEGDQTRIGLIVEFLRARDAQEGERFASTNPETGESIFFDVVNTENVETSRELMLASLTGALEFLRSAPTGSGEGGFGTTDMSKWIWGLRHQARFESLLAPYLGNDPAFSLFTAPLSIDTNRLPLADNLTPGDPRSGLRWFPRPGDQWNIDAANPGFSGRSFTHGSGPVMRMVFSLKPGEVSGFNIIPGGQSGITDSPFFDDQLKQWLANEAFPIRFSVEDVVAGSTGREVYRPTSLD